MNQQPCTVEICRWRNDAPFAYSMTYDEGTVDALANALPIHEEFGFPGHVDVVAGQLGRPRDCFGSTLNGYVQMSPDELKVMLERGWGVGNHSWSHYVYPCQPGVDLYREVVWSKYRLEDMIDHPVRIFAIPNDTYNYPPVLDLVKQHYLACAYVEEAPNRPGFDLYRIGNINVAAGAIKPRPGWAEELRTPNLSIEFLQDTWQYETSHLVMWNVPQDHKCVTPEALTQRFEKLRDISEGRLWAAKPDDVIDYVLLRRHLQIANVRSGTGGEVIFDVEGDWPVGVMNSLLTLRIAGPRWGDLPRVESRFDGTPGGFALHDKVESVVRDGDDLLITLQLTPHRTVCLSP